MPETTIWPLEPHTKAKHQLLAGYLGAWLPIMAQARRKPERVVVLDGFAGPGVYDSGEEGSPLIALRTIIEHKHWHLLEKTPFDFVFFEPRDGRYESLVQQLDRIQAEHASWPSNVRVRHRKRSFEAGGEWVVDGLERTRHAPAFLFVDPFGVSGLPMDLIRRLSQFDKAEVFINFMLNTTQRFATAGNIDQHLVELFGTDEFTQANDHRDRRTFLRGLYQRQLEEVCGFKYVLSFEMVNRSGQSYDLFYGTRHLTGLDRMKGVMWKVDPSGTFSFHDRRLQGQASLFTAPETRSPLVEAELVRRFAGQGPMRVEDIYEFVLVDTPFAGGHWRGPLGVLEKADRVRVVSTPQARRRRGAFPDGTVVEIT